MACKIIKSTKHIPKHLRHKLIHKKARTKKPKRKHKPKHIPMYASTGNITQEDDKELTHNPFKEVL